MVGALVALLFRREISVPVVTPLTITRVAALRSPTAASAAGMRKTESLMGTSPFCPWF